ncbi:MAG: Na/Pi symporter [Pirellulales bacterium]|nr:Na/Pi symporter [Pirellulales bacterium]
MTNPAKTGILATIGRWILFLFLLYMFLVAIQLFGGAIKYFGKDQGEALIGALANPFAGLAVGVLATVLFQSSSVTTSTIVAMVGSGQLSVSAAVPMIMGANVGTSVTNTLVSLGYVTRNREFRRAFAGATVHDFFNVLTVAVLFPIEMLTHFLERSAVWLTTFIPMSNSDVGFKSPIKTAVKWLAKKIQSLLENGLGLEGAWLNGALCALAFAMIYVTLVMITRNMKTLMADRIEQWLNRALSKSGLLGLGIGAVITVLVQSSSITTSLLVPMFGAGVLSLRAGFPIMVGANLGTTITALLAALVTGPAGLVIALVHLLFNICGTLLFFPIAKARNLPIACAEKLVDKAVTNRLWVVFYILFTFVCLPLIGIIIWK